MVITKEELNVRRDVYRFAKNKPMTKAQITIAVSIAGNSMRAEVDERKAKFQALRYIDNVCAGRSSSHTVLRDK